MVFAVGQFGTKVKQAGLAEQVLEFVFDRLRARYEDEGVDVSVYLSVRALQPGSALDFDQRVQAVQAFRKLPEADALAAVNKRVSNLLSKADNLGTAEVDPGLFADAKEFSLNSAIAKAENAVKPLIAERDYAQALARLASLREPVDAFFEAVMINADDAGVRKTATPCWRACVACSSISPTSPYWADHVETADSRSGRGDQLRLRRLHQVGGGVDPTARFDRGHRAVEQSRLDGGHRHQPVRHRPRLLRHRDPGGHARAFARVSGRTGR